MPLVVLPDSSKLKDFNPKTRQKSLMDEMASSFPGDVLSADKVSGGIIIPCNMEES